MQWEYHSHKHKGTGFWSGSMDEDEINRVLNEYGQDSWELAETIESSAVYDSSRWIVFIFKRPKA